MTTQPMPLEETLTKGQALFLRVQKSPELREKLRKRLAASCVKQSNGCWKWNLRLDKWGYGIIRLPGRVSTLAHRISFVVHGGEFTQEKKLILHSCHNPWCINPDHLRAGTQKENEADKFAAERQYSKLTASKVRHIRELMSLGVSNSDISRQFGICISHVCNIRRGKSWISTNNDPQP